MKTKLILKEKSTIIFKRDINFVKITKEIPHDFTLNEKYQNIKIWPQIDPSYSPKDSSVKEWHVLFPFFVGTLSFTYIMYFEIFDPPAYGFHGII